MTNTALETRANEILASMSEHLPAQASPIEASSEEQSFYADLAAKVGPAAARLLSIFGKRRVVLEADGSEAEAPAGSYVGGHPFVAAGEDFSWPLADDGVSPMVFLMQVNFAELPRLDGYPESGLLQWWIDGADEFLGMSFEDDATGREGLLVKFYPEAVLGSAASAPTDPIPQEGALERGEDVLGPLWGLKPFRLVPRESLSLPGWEDATIGADTLDLLNDLRDYIEEEDWAERYSGLFEPATQVGGYPYFVQGDPRQHSSNPQPLILQLDSMATEQEDVSMWGDAGTAQLFGDLDALRRGDVGGFWWNWACG